jgi:hypothetical protein
MAVTHATPQGWCGSAFRIVAPRAQITLLSATEPDAVEGTEPGVLWGTDGFRTDGRLACLIQQDDRPAEAVVVHGRQILDATGLPLLELPHPSKLVRSPLSAVCIRAKGLTTDD